MYTVFTSALAAAVLAMTTFALPSPDMNQSLNTKRDIPLPSSINCGSPTATGWSGFPNVPPPEISNIPLAAGALAKQPQCKSPDGSGKCIRVACEGVTGIWMCNTDGHDGPYNAPCNQVAAYAYSGNVDGEDVTGTCRNKDGLVAGQAFDGSGNWNVVTGKANCGDPADAPPEAQ